MNIYLGYLCSEVSVDKHSAHIQSVFDAAIHIQNISTCLHL